MLGKLSSSSRSLFYPLTVKTRLMSTIAKTPELNNTNLWKSKGFINNEWVESDSGSTFPVTDPGNGNLLGHVPEMGVSETRRAVDAASEAFKTFSKTTAKSRQDLLNKVFALINENADDLAKIVTVENGKPLADAKGEVVYGNSFFEWFAGEAVRTYGDIVPAANPDLRNIVIKQPIGVCGILTPWNFPIAMITRKLAPAIAAGCTTVIKTPAETPYSALAVAHLCKEAGVPAGVVNVVTTDKNVAEVGKEVCENPAIKKVSFTGSTRIGQLLMQQSSQTLKKLSFELGGNAPFIVFDDADVDAAVAGAIACKFRSSGQTCVCANRIYVQSSVYAEFASKLAQKVDAFKLGYGLDEGTTHGPLIAERALEKVEQHVDDAVKRGAEVLSGGKRVGGNYFAPTVLANVPEDALVNCDETFGPLAALTKFDTEEQVIALANNVDVGLAGYLYSRDIGRVWRVSEGLEVGMVGTNAPILSQACIPFGGQKMSGFGREGGKQGIEEYLTTKLIAMGGITV
ncbi:hypothetical protein E3Q22_03906 [Wallemia mellicola]|uniref:Succinate-semialdehyde dehydrogenase n=1 Tax=Wallemia mellicola TaxID=1708541 RepID=A0A4T0LZR7_9BASI|nr:hypothetical protein E3Q22_03906 [Wallemia mellicola]